MEGIVIRLFKSLGTWAFVVMIFGFRCAKEVVCLLTYFLILELYSI